MCTEDSPSGLWRTLGKRVGCKPSGVRIPHPPPPDPGTCPGSGVLLLVPRLISGRRESCPPASRPRRELRSARRLVVRPGPAGLAAASNRAGHVAASGQAPQASRRPPIGRGMSLRVARPCRRPSAPQSGPTTPACHMRPQLTGAIARLCSLRGDRQPGAARLAGPRPRPFRLRDPRRSPLPGARRGPRPSRTASSVAGPSRCSSSRPRTPNQ